MPLENDAPPAVLAAYDQFIMEARARHPGHTNEWYELWIMRVLHYAQHNGDMTGAPELPEN